MRQRPDTPAELKARALRHLVRREHSRDELARKLAPHADSPEAVAALLDDLARRKQLSDQRFAEERARVLSRKYGPARVRHDLAGKGIAASLIPSVGAQDELGRARLILERRYRNAATTREERARRVRFLQGRGFATEVAVKLVCGGEEAEQS